jgi:C1A family cysteine protease
MFEGTIRVGLLILIGLAIVLAAIWYLSVLYQEIRGGGEAVIDALVVVEQDGKVNDDVGKPLAQMLQARLQALARELQDAQNGLTTSPSPSTLTGGKFFGPLRGVQFFDPRIGLQTTLLQPIDLELSVAGVDVGGLIPWLQRGFTNRRTLHFTIYKEGNDALIFGSLSALGISDEGLRLVVKGADEKVPSLAVIVDQLAHEMLRRYLAQSNKNKLELLDPPEFFSLADVIVNAAQANRRIIGGRAATSDFAALIPDITALADKVPNWPELCYLAAWISDSANDSDHALKYYHQAVPIFVTEKNTAVVDSINTRIAALTKKTEPPDSEAANKELPAAIDYSDRIDFIRDSGSEGSVVGQALAVALEYQIATTKHESAEISARFIYYAARKAGGIDIKTDGGAQIKDAIRVLEHEGAVKEGVWPYQPGKYAEAPPPAVKDAERFHITDARQLNSLRDVKLALIANGPVVAGITVYEGMEGAETAKSGVVPLPRKNESVIGGHAIVIVGYDDTKKLVKFANSWGKGWGDKGFGYLPYEYLDKYMSDSWTFKLAAR